jgi:16S rRNA (guanine527-N7)-methyltransferase
MGSKGGVQDGDAFQGMLEQGAAALGIDLAPAGALALAAYHAELKRWSGKVNLIAKNSTDQQVIESHFLDSLTLLPLLPTGARLLDIGTGAGFPGLVCKAARDDLFVTLVEPRLKRVSFLRHIVRTLGLKGVEILAGRIEDEQLLSPTVEFTHITSRAVSDIAGFLAMAGRFMRPETRLVCMKGPKWQEELRGAGALIDTLPVVLEDVVEQTLPYSGALRALLVFAVSGEAVLAKSADFC